jgi:hypothetical protein
MVIRHKPSLDGSARGPERFSQGMDSRTSWPAGTLADDLAVALNTVDSVQVAIRRADTKASALAGFQLTVLTIALGSAEHLGRVWDSGAGHRFAAGILTVCLLGGLSASLALSGAVLWPRLSLEHDQNRFAFPALAARLAPPTAEPTAARDDAWRLAMQLSRTATRKYRTIRAVLWSMSASTASVLAWLFLAASAQ